MGATSKVPWSLDYQGIVENAVEGVFQSTPDGHLLMANPALARMFGAGTPSQLLTEVTDVASQLWAEPPQRRSYRELLETDGSTQSFEAKLRRLDGSTFWALLHTRAVCEPDGQVAYYEGTVEDISARKSAEEELRRERDRSQRYLDLVEVMLVGMDLSGRITLLNRKACRILGYREHELLGENWFDQCVPAEVRDDHRRRLEQLSGDFAPMDGREGPVLTKSGERRLVAWRSTVLTDEAGTPSGVLSAGEDITTHRQLENQLRQALKIDAIGGLAGGIAHDFNNLLTAIFGYGDLLKDHLGDDAEGQSDLQELLAAAERARSLTQQLLAFSRKQVLQPVDLSFNELISDTHMMLRRVVPENIELTVTTSPELWPVTADRTQLERVLLNLVVNARDAMVEGGHLAIETDNVILDQVRARRYAPMTPGSYVRLTVRDTGTGMPDEVKKHLFEPFFTTKGPGKGTGLGLSMVYGTVKQSGGFVWIESAVGRGTTVQVYLPRGRVKLATTALPLDATTTALSGSETILVVEDDDRLRALVRRSLVQQGYRVLTAANADEALRIYGQCDEPIHLLLTDVVMPGMSGRTLAESLQSLAPTLRVLYMSGHTHELISRQGVLDVGVNLLPKPFTPKVLALKVREVLSV